VPPPSYLLAELELGSERFVLARPDREDRLQ
jgi:hypothetical protein